MNDSKRNELCFFSNVLNRGINISEIHTLSGVDLSKLEAELLGVDLAIQSRLDNVEHPHSNFEDTNWIGRARRKLGVVGTFVRITNREIFLRRLLEKPVITIQELADACDNVSKQDSALARPGK